MELPLAITIITLRVVVMVLHTTGSYLLICLYRDGQNKPEHLFLLNLSISEIVIAVLDILSEILKLSKNDLALNIKDYVDIANGYGISLVYYLCMMFLTVDRLLEIILSIKYYLYCDEKKAKRLLKVTWGLSILSCITISIVHGVTKADVFDPLYMYIYPTMDFIFIIIAFVTYVFLFRKYRLSRIPPTQKSAPGSRKRRETALRVFRTSQFHVPVLLIATFLVFMIIPDLLNPFGVTGSEESLVYKFCIFSFGLAYLTDAVIYIFLSPAVKNLLLKNLRIRKQVTSLRREQVNSDTQVWTVNMTKADNRL